MFARLRCKSSSLPGDVGRSFDHKFFFIPTPVLRRKLSFSAGKDACEDRSPSCSRARVCCLPGLCQHHVDLIVNLTQGRSWACLSSSLPVWNLTKAIKDGRQAPSNHRYRISELSPSSSEG